MGCGSSFSRGPWLHRLISAVTEEKSSSILITKSAWKLFFGRWHANENFFCSVKMDLSPHRVGFREGNSVYSLSLVHLFLTWWNKLQQLSAPLSCLAQVMDDIVLVPRIDFRHSIPDVYFCTLSPLCLVALHSFSHGACCPCWSLSRAWAYGPKNTGSPYFEWCLGLASRHVNSVLQGLGHLHM